MEAKKSKETTKGMLESSSTYISAKFKLFLSGKLGAGVPVGGPASRGAGAEDGDGGESKQELLISILIAWNAKLVLCLA